MKENDVRARAFAMPLTSPAFPPGPTASSTGNISSSPTAPIRRSSRAVVPEPLEIDARRWSSTSSSACRIRPASATTPRAARSSPCRSRAARAATRTACSSMTRRRSPAGASCGAFPRSSRARPAGGDVDTLVGTLDYGPVRIATGTMGYKHAPADHGAVLAALGEPNFLLKIIPHVDGTPRICELVEYQPRGHRR